MTDRLLITRQEETGQLVLEGPDTGPAGEATLTPARGLALMFDRASGRLCQVAVDLSELGSQAGARGCGNRAVRQMLCAISGASVEPQTLLAAAGVAGRSYLSADPSATAALSRLARFDAARATSPVPADSPLWHAEAAVLALQAGLRERAHAEARAAVRGLAALLAGTPLPRDLLGPVLAAAELAPADEADAAAAVREGCANGFSGSLSDWLAAYGPRQNLPDVGRVPGSARDAETRPGLLWPRDRRTLSWGLDLTLLPANLALPGLTPDSDVRVCRGEPDDVLIVRVRLGPGAADDALRRCRVRLVNSARRQVVSVAPLIRDADTAVAGLHIPGGLARTGADRELWIEVVADAERPVRGRTLREIRQALRWADSALRASRRPRGLAPHLAGARWHELKAESWLACGRYWGFADDRERASQAACNARRKEHRLAAEPGYLAETLGR